MFTSLTAALQWTSLFWPLESIDSTTTVGKPCLSGVPDARYSPAPGAQSANFKRALAEGHRVFRRDVCTDVFGSSRSSNTCNPSGTLCCIISGSVYPQCQTLLSKGWCCTEDSTCYVDQASACDEADSVSCPKLAAGTSQACCPKYTTCDTQINASDANVRCRIRSSALVSLASATLSTSSSSSSKTSSITTTSSSVVTGASSTSAGLVTPAAAPAGATSTAPSSTPAPPPSGLSGGAIAGIVIGGVLAFAIGIGLWFLFSKRQKRQQQELHTPGQSPTMQHPGAAEYMSASTASPGYYPYKDHHDTQVPLQELPGSGNVSELHGDVRYR